MKLTPGFPLVASNGENGQKAATASTPPQWLVLLKNTQQLVQNL